MGTGVGIPWGLPTFISVAMGCGLKSSSPPCCVSSGTQTSWGVTPPGRRRTEAAAPGGGARGSGSRAAAPSRRRAGDTSAAKADKARSSSSSVADYSFHLVVTASIGGCLLMFNVTLFFCLYCRQMVGSAIYMYCQ